MVSPTSPSLTQDNIYVMEKAYVLSDNGGR